MWVVKAEQLPGDTIMTSICIYSGRKLDKLPSSLPSYCWAPYAVSRVIVLTCYCTSPPVLASVNAESFFPYSAFRSNSSSGPLLPPSHGEFWNRFLKWNAGLCIYPHHISLCWLQPNIPAGWGLLQFCLSEKRKPQREPKPQKKTKPWPQGLSPSARSPLFLMMPLPPCSSDVCKHPPSPPSSVYPYCTLVCIVTIVIPLPGTGSRLLS